MISDMWANVLGVNVSVGTVDTAFDTMRSWIRDGKHHYVTITGAHGVIECQRDETLMGIHNRAGMVTADGMPLVWMSKLQGRKAAERVYGPDLMRHALAESTDGSVRHYLYGATEETLADLREAIERDYPGANIVGSYAPPFRKVGAREDAAVISAINATEPDIIWVGLSTPKQEYWMANHISQLNAHALVGVGAAFDFLAGNKVQAPRVIQRSGFEWLYRSITEPRRLVRRYADIVPRFLFLGAMQLMGLRKWQAPNRGVGPEKVVPQEN